MRGERREGEVEDGALMLGWTQVLVRSARSCQSWSGGYCQIISPIKGRGTQIGEAFKELMHSYSTHIATSISLEVHSSY